MDTLVAPATPAGRGAMSVVRLSGPRALPVAQLLCPDGPPWRPRRAQLRSVRAGALTDAALVTWMPGPRSFTGEDVVELSCHGNPVVVEAVVDAAVRAGARPARPGEFTRRAVLHGRLDVVQAEGLAAVIDAATAEGVALAQQGLSGALGSHFAALRERLLDLGAELEARLDQPGGDLEVDDDATVAAALQALAADAHALAATWAQARPRLEGARVALVGPVNAGKSSLFNHLVGARRALVSDTPGTTRDVVERGVRWGGLDLTLQDTAGLRDDPGPLEAQGLEIGRQAALEADLRVVVWPRTRPAGAALAALLADCPAPRLLVATFADQPAHAQAPAAELSVANPTGAGIDALRGRLVALLGRSAPVAGAAVVVSQRQHARLLEVAACAEHAAEALCGPLGPAVAAEEVTRGLEALAALTGEDVREAVLDRLFARFCIGK